MKKLIFASAAALVAASASAGLYGDTPDATHAWAVHDRNRPNPVKIVAEPGLPPSDAIILFDGTEKTFANWCSMKMEPTKWKLVNGTLESVKGAGYIRTKAEYGPNFQLHVEWATPVKVEGVEVTTVAEILATVYAYHVGDTVELEVLRDNEMITVSTVLIEQDSNYFEESNN